MATLAKLGQVKMGMQAARGVAPVAYTYIDVKESVDTTGLKTQAIANDDLKAHLENEPHFIGAKFESTFALTKNLRTRTAASTLPANGPVATGPITLFAEHPDIVLIGEAMGNIKIFGDGGSESFTTWSAMDVTKKILTVVASTNYTVGEMICIKTGDDPSTPTVTDWEVNQVVAVGVGTITCQQPFAREHPVAGADNDKVYAGTTAFTTDYLQLTPVGATVQGQAAADLYTLTDMRATKMSIEANPSEFGVLSLEYDVPTWTRGTGAVPAYAALPAGDKRQVLGGKARWVPTGGSPVEFDVSKIMFDPGIERNRSKALHSTGVAESFVTAHNGTITIDPVWDSEDLFTAFAAQTTGSLVIYWGGQPGKMFTQCFPSCIVDVDPSLTERDGKKVHNLVLRPVRHAHNGNAWDDTKAENKSCYFAAI